jgi:hypothetical protein
LGQGSEIFGEALLNRIVETVVLGMKEVLSSLYHHCLTISDAVTAVLSIIAGVFSGFHHLGYTTTRRVETFGALSREELV